MSAYPLNIRIVCNFANLLLCSDFGPTTGTIMSEFIFTSGLLKEEAIKNVISQPDRLYPINISFNLITKPLRRSPNLLLRFYLYIPTTFHSPFGKRGIPAPRNHTARSHGHRGNVTSLNPQACRRFPILIHSTLGRTNSP